MSLKLAIWDMDGTIVDSRAIIQEAMVRAFEVCDLEPPVYDATRHVVGLGLAEACGQLAPAGISPHALDRLVNAYREAFVARRSEPDFEEPLYPGAIDTLERLARAGWLMGVATGKARRGVDALFASHPLQDYFDTVWCADDGPGKPNPFMVLEAMKAVGRVPAESLIIGDAVHDMAMGRAAGITCHGVAWGFGTGPELIDAGAHLVHGDFASLNAGLDAFDPVAAG
jgi:phosphoglycolate phosphatase